MLALSEPLVIERIFSKHPRKATIDHAVSHALSPHYGGHDNTRADDAYEVATNAGEMLGRLLTTLQEKGVLSLDEVVTIIGRSDVKVADGA